MEGFKRALEVSKLPPGSMKTVEAGGEEVLLVNVGGEYYGSGANCKHEEWDLSEGTLEDTKVICAGHGTVWELNKRAREFDGPFEHEPLYDVKSERRCLYGRTRV